MTGTDTDVDAARELGRIRQRTEAVLELAAAYERLHAAIVAVRHAGGLEAPNPHNPAPPTPTGREQALSRGKEDK